MNTRPVPCLSRRWLVLLLVVACCLLVPKKNVDFSVIYPFLVYFVGEMFIARKSRVASTWPSIAYFFVPYDGQQKHIKPISQHPFFATTKKTWNKEWILFFQEFSVFDPLLLLLVSCLSFLARSSLLRWLGNPNSSWPLLLK